MRTEEFYKIQHKKKNIDRASEYAELAIENHGDPEMEKMMKTLSHLPGKAATESATCRQRQPAVQPVKRSDAGKSIVRSCWRAGTLQNSNSSQGRCSQKYVRSFLGTLSRKSSRETCRRIRPQLHGWPLSRQFSSKSRHLKYYKSSECHRRNTH